MAVCDQKEEANAAVRPSLDATAPLPRDTRACQLSLSTFASEIVKQSQNLEHTCLEKNQRTIQLSIIVPTHKRSHLLKNLLEDLKKQKTNTPTIAVNK